MPSQPLTETVEGVPSLRGVFITAMPDCLLYDSWTAPQEDWSPEDAASYFGDLIRANREGLKALRSWSAQMQVTIESADLLLILRELRSDFVVTIAFQRDVSLGMARLHVKRMIDSIGGMLPEFDVQERPRAIRVSEFLHKYAPDPHAALQRVALRTGLGVATLKTPEKLDEAQVALFETAVQDLLGLDGLTL